MVLWGSNNVDFPMCQQTLELWTTLFWESLVVFLENLTEVNVFVKDDEKKGTSYKLKFGG